ncbi:uncharacterized protein MONOS_13773 [Monocercomonoides exilis]|uniref:uncharacterized protein n=1 Tax=Monocercomonoides exilis TaxID=2049356 RepID=UPI00355A0862|nr:hypothetical protein MONOS_13773 [Monocercomonoides exilis]|eukprot:MONOS_13773.1-p1 / transcript=MONOS_13773.1 / gene=MONOS_13773 / organism=Monocercomonoides_exilis_PA203 / gene_product=unspecified product / transcript_product=unspecified product / location=Mono_scaffold00880:22305-25117(-) / protein_length=590 / sequence_SO=supercontig / SO=protein_coding / is_pseudo=false
MNLQTFLSNPYDLDPRVDFSGRLWEGQHIVSERIKHAKQTYQQIIVRFTKNWMSEKAFFENIKSRKFQPLGEEGTIGDVWSQQKKEVEVLEKASEDLMNKYHSMLEAMKKEEKDYEVHTSAIEKQWQTSKSKKAKAIEEMNKKHEKYAQVFNSWDETEALFSKSQKDPTVKPANLQKLTQKTLSLMQQKAEVESAYTDSVKACQQAEYEYDLKAIELLRLFEKLEHNRLLSMKNQLTEFYQIWDASLAIHRECVSRCLHGMEEMNVISDLVNFAVHKATLATHPPYEHAVYLSRKHSDAPMTLPIGPQPPAIPIISSGDGSTYVSQPAASSSAPAASYDMSASSVPSASSHVQRLPPPAAPEPRVQQMVVGYLFEATNEGELSVNEGDVVELLNAGEVSEGGWAHCRRIRLGNGAPAGGEMGFVPYDYLNKIEEAEGSNVGAAADNSQAAAPTAAVEQQQEFSASSNVAATAAPVASSSDPAAAAAAASNADVPPTLPNPTQPAAEQWSAEQEQANQASASSAETAEGAGIVANVKAKVLYEYTASSESEISIEVDENVMIQPDTGTGWCLCVKANGQYGYVPTDYVQPI